MLGFESLRLIRIRLIHIGVLRSLHVAREEVRLEKAHCLILI